MLDKMTAPEYLAYIQECAVQSQFARHAQHDSDTGLRTMLVDGIIYASVEDKQAYEAFLQKMQYLTPTDVNRIVELEETFVPFYLEGVANYKRRLLNAADHAKKLVPDHETLLDQVPVGVSYLSYVHGGAMPVPTGGDVVTISAGLSYLFFWTTWIAICNGEDPALSMDIRQRLWAALPQLAVHILGDQPQNGQFMYFAEVASKSKKFRAEKTNRVTWLAETFIILHEFGHIINGHTAAMRQWLPESELDNTELLARRLMQREFEFAADGFAAEALKCVAYEAPLDPGSVIDEILEALSAVFILFDFGESESIQGVEHSTHPPASDRLKRILQIYLGEDPEILATIDGIVNVCILRRKAAYSLKSKEADKL